MTKLAWWIGAAWELITGWPWTDIAGAVVLFLTLASVWAAILVWQP